MQCAGLSLSWPLLLWSTGSRRTGSVVVAHGPSCSTACGVFPDQCSNLCPLHWQADSQPLRHQGSPSLAAFNIFSLNLIFVSLISMCLDVFFLGFILYGTLYASWTWMTISFPMLGKFSTIMSSNIFSDPFFFSSSGTPTIQMLVHLVLSQRSLRLSSILFIHFFFYSAPQQLFPPFCLPAHLFVLLPRLFCY